MSDDFPQFSERAPRRPFRRLFLLPIAAEEDGAIQGPFADGTDTPPQQKVLSDTPPYQHLPEDKPTPPPLSSPITLGTRPPIAPGPERQDEGEGEWIAGRSQLWQPGIYRFDGLDDGFEAEKLATIPVPALRGGMPDTRNWPDVQDTDDLDARFYRRDTVPMTVLKGIAQLQGQSPPVMQSEITGAANNAALIGLGTILGNIFKYGNNVLIQRGFGAASYGLYTLGMSMVTLFVAVFNLGLDDAMVRYVSIYKSRSQGNLLRGLTLFCSILAAVGGTIGGLLLFFLAPPLAALRHAPGIAPLLTLMALLIPLMSVQQLWSSGLQGFKAFKNRVLLQRVIIPGLLTILLIVVIIFFHSITAVVMASILSTMLSAVLNMRIFFDKIKRLKSRGAREYDIREWTGFALPNFLTSIVDTALDATDTLLLAYFVASNVELGRYAAANKISIFISVPLLTLNVTFAPTIAELFSKGEKKTLSIMFQVVTKWVISLSLPICLIAMLFSRSLLAISGQSFIDAWPLLLALAVGNMLNAGTGPVGYMLSMTGHQKLMFLNSLAAIIVNIGLGLILTPRFGAFGTAIATGLALGVVNLMRLLQVYLLLKINPYRWDTLKPIGAGLMSAFMTGLLLYPVNLINPHVLLFDKNLPLQLTLIPVFLACYLGLLVLFKFSPEDKIVLDKMRKKFVQHKK